MAESKEMSLDTVGGGYARELFQIELDKLLANIDDPNCDPDFTREITLKLRVKPRADSDSGELATELSVTSKLASRRPVKGTAYMGRKGDNIVAVAYDPRQRALFADEQDDDVVPIDRKAAHNE